MGVKGLLKALSDVQRDVHVVDLAGLRVGIDAYCFLHRGKRALISDLLAGRPSVALVQPLLDVVKLLLRHGAEPIAVFDGAKLPAKDFVESERQQARETARQHCRVLLQQSNGTTPCDGACLSKAAERAMEVTPLQASQCFGELASLGVSFVVAPYEADAQLAHLALTGKVDICITEDSDLLVYGCPRVMFKFDSVGNGSEIRLADLHKSCGMLPFCFTLEALLDLSILAGCDYLPGIPGLGMRKASQLLQLSSGDAARAIELASAKGLKVPVGFRCNFQVARLVFRSQTVFDVSSRQTQPLQPLPENWHRRHSVILRLGRALSDDVAAAVADGELHPETFEPFFNTYARGYQHGHALRDKPTRDAITSPGVGQIPEATCMDSCVSACSLSMSGEKDNWLNQLHDVFGKRLAGDLASFVWNQQTFCSQETPGSTSFLWSQASTDDALAKATINELLSKPITSVEVESRSLHGIFASKQFRAPRLLGSDSIEDKSASCAFSNQRTHLSDIDPWNESSLDNGLGPLKHDRPHVALPSSFALGEDLKNVIDILGAWETKSIDSSRDGAIPMKTLTAVFAAGAATKARASDNVKLSHEESQPRGEDKEDRCDWRTAIWSEWQRTSFGGKQRSLWQCIEQDEDDSVTGKRARIDFQKTS